MRLCVPQPALWIALATLVGLSTASQADSLSQFVATAPSVRAALLRAEAERHAAQAAGILPDAQVEVMASSTNMGGDDDPGVGIALVQPLPRRGELGASRNFAAARTQSAWIEAQMTAGDVAAEAASLLAERDYALARAKLSNSIAQRFEDSLPAVAGRIASSNEELGGWASLRARILALRLEVSTFETEAESLSESVRALLGMPADAALPVFEAPSTELDERIAAPAAFARSRAAEARAEREMRRAAGRPMSAVKLAYEREFMRGADENRVELSLMMDLPFRARRSAQALAESSGAMEAAAMDDVRLAEARLSSDRSRALRAKALAERTQTSTTASAGLIETEIGSMLARAEVGAEGMAAAVRLADLARDLAELQMIPLEANRDAQLAAAALWVHFPPALNQSSAQP